MLISFSAKNFRSIREKSTLTLVAAPDKRLEDSNVFEFSGVRMVTALALYGANASGKTNMLRAIWWMRFYVVHSISSLTPIQVEPYLLDELGEKLPTLFECELFVGEKRMRYGFEVLKGRIVSEWLVQLQGNRRTLLFTRENQEINVGEGSFKDSKGLEKRTPKSALFVSVCATLNVKLAREIVEEFLSFKIVSGINDDSTFNDTARMLRVGTAKHDLLKIIQEADLAVRDVEASPSPSEQNNPTFGQDRKRSYEIKTHHDRYNSDGKVVGDVTFDLVKQGSQGTIKIVSLSSALFEALKYGQLLIIDELEARLHPLLTKAIVKLFSTSSNPHHAQLVFATHDVLLMDPKIMRRDQIYFASKSYQGDSEFTCLARFDASTVRPTSKFAKQYLAGVFGAIPSAKFTRPEALSKPKGVSTPTNEED